MARKGKKAGARATARALTPEIKERAEQMIAASNGLFRLEDHDHTVSKVLTTYAAPLMGLASRTEETDLLATCAVQAWNAGFFRSSSLVHVRNLFTQVLCDLLGRMDQVEALNVFEQMRRRRRDEFGFCLDFILDSEAVALTGKRYEIRAHWRLAPNPEYVPTEVPAAEPVTPDAPPAEPE